ncbi:MAG: GNAT family N-acetyltransferase [Candidatus Pacebacteria bacterium]|nr:GNAT family N-acetyltransferase [Candidatus Paceibacterota bacterium]
MLSDECCTLIAVVKNNVVGLLSGGITKGEVYRNLPKTAEAGIIFVLEEYRSQGIGQKLFDEFFN